jgi:hypothetical protein
MPAPEARPAAAAARAAHHTPAFFPRPPFAAGRSRAALITCVWRARSARWRAEPSARRSEQGAGRSWDASATQPAHSERARPSMPASVRRCVHRLSSSSYFRSFMRSFTPLPCSASSLIRSPFNPSCRGGRCARARRRRHSVVACQCAPPSRLRRRRGARAGRALLRHRRLA